VSGRALVRIVVAILIALVLGWAYAIVKENSPAAAAVAGFSH
jgi:hypothetical protein